MRYLKKISPESQDQMGGTIHAIRCLRSRARWRMYALMVSAVLLWCVTEAQHGGSEPYLARLSISGEMNTMESVREAAQMLDDAALRGVLVLANSPGGSPAVSEAWQSLFSRLQSKKIPVVVIAEDVCASGCYLAVSGANRIYSYHGSILGSIGAIMIVPNVSNVLKKWGVDVTVVRSGDLKAEPNWFVSPSKEALAEAGKLVDTTADWFVQTVLAQRKITDKEVIKRLRLAGIFSSQEALSMGLIDAIGTEWEAMEYLRSLGGASVELPVRDMTASPWWKTFWDRMVHAAVSSGMLKLI